MISQKTRYGLKAVIALAKNPSADPVLITDLAKKERLPQKFLEAILLELKKQGILTSKKGKGGGYALAMAPAEIKVGAIIRALEGPPEPLPKEQNEITIIIEELMTATSAVLDQTSLEDLMEKARCCQQNYGYMI